MAIVYKYLFYKIHNFYIKTFNEKEIPHWFSAGILAILVFFNIEVLLEGYSYFFDKSLLGVYTKYDKYLVLLLAFIGIFYVSNKKRHEIIMQFCEQLPKSRKKQLAIISSAYVLVSLICFFWLSYLIREYNK